MIVADCSAVVDALTTEDGDQIVELLVDQRVAVPILIDYEFVSAIRGLSQGNHLSAPRARDALNDFDSLLLERWAFPDVMRRRVFELRHSMTAYDAAYVVLAEALGCSMITRDRRLATAAAGLVDVIVA